MVSTIWTMFQCMVLWHQVHSHSCQPSPPSISRALHRATLKQCVFLVPFHGSTISLPISITPFPVPFSTDGHCASLILCRWIVAILVLSRSLYVTYSPEKKKCFFFSSSWNPVFSSSLFPPPALTLFKYFFLLISIGVIFQRVPLSGSVLLGSEWLLCLCFCSAFPPLVPFLFLQLSGPFRIVWEVRK